MARWLDFTLYGDHETADSNVFGNLVENACLPRAFPVEN